MFRCKKGYVFFRFTKVLLTIIVVVGMMVPATLAHANNKTINSELESAEEEPMKPTVAKDQSPDPNAKPLGMLTPEEIKALEEKIGIHCDEEDDGSGKHFDLRWHAHYITLITNTYIGEAYRGIVAAGSNPYNSPVTLSYSQARGVSNSYNVSMGFDADVVSASVGYSVSYGTTVTASYSVNVPAYKYCQILLWDVYNVKEFYCKTEYYLLPFYAVTGIDYGSGWASQWSNFRFSYTLT